MNFAKRFETLAEMLTYRRPANSLTEAEFIEEFILPLGVERDKFGNYYKIIRTADDEFPATMFTAHTDSVHHLDGRQSITIDNVVGMITTEDPESNCLGADDATGIFIMMEMIEANKPGVYAFFREEEIGGHGSSHASASENFWVGVTQCVSFDRTSYEHSVITHQWSGQGASETWAQHLADLLRTHTNRKYTTDDGGIFTDSANFTEFVGECTNISVGYYNEHTKNERQDLRILDELITACLAINWETLPVTRLPGEDDMMGGSGWWAQYCGSGSIADKKKTDAHLDSIEFTLSDPDFRLDRDLDKYCNAMGIDKVYMEVLKHIAAHMNKNNLPNTSFEDWWAMNQLQDIT